MTVRKKCWMCGDYFYAESGSESYCPSCTHLAEEFEESFRTKAPARRCVIDETRYCVDCGVCKEA